MKTQNVGTLTKDAADNQSLGKFEERMYNFMKEKPQKVIK